MTRRRSDRIHLQIPVCVSGKDKSGTTFEEETVTVNINHHGACITLGQALEPDQLVRVKNLRNGHEQEFRVVGLVSQVFGSHGEWGMELSDPSVDFWGVKFTPPPESTQPKVLIECQACSKATLVTVSRLEYDLLLHTGLISHHCEQCGETTRWQPSDQPPVAWTEAKVDVDHERRKTRRIRLAMRLQLRNEAGQTEIVQTMDVSRGGICFFSKKPYEVGDLVTLFLPSREKKELAETKGRVTWARTVLSGRLYGVSYVGQEAATMPSHERVAQVA